MGTHITNIKTNIRGGCDHELSPCTAVIGKNGTGKTTVVDAISLATIGQARSAGLGKDARTLDVLKPEGAEKLEALVKLSDNAVVDWQLSGSKKTWRHSGGEGKLPIATFHADAVQSMLLGDPKRIRQAIIDSSGQVIQLHKLLASLPADGMSAQLLVSYLTRHKVQLVVDDNGVPIGSQELGTEVVSAMIKDIDKRRRELSKEVKQLDKAKEAAAFPLTEEDLEELKNLEEAIHAEAFLPGDANEAAARINAITGQQVAFQDQLNQTPVYEEMDVLKVAEQIDQLTDIKRVQESLLEYVNEAGAQSCNCVVCGSQNVQVSTIVAQCEEATRQVNNLDQWLTTAKSAIHDRKVLTKSINGLTDELKKLHEVVSQGHVTVSADRKRYEELRSRRNQAEAAQSALDALPRISADKKTHDTLKDVLNDQLEVSVHAAAAVIEQKMNTFLPKNTRARISADGRNVAISMQQGAYLDYRALSGAGRATTMVAFASATIPHDAPPVRLLVIDEVWLDSVTVRALMKAVATSVAKGDGFSQALVCLVTWTGQAPQGWTLVQLDPKKMTKGAAKKNGAGDTQDATQAQTVPQ